MMCTPLLGWSCHLHDLHHRAAHCVCGHGADLQRPAQPQRPGRGQRPDEGLKWPHVLLLLHRRKPSQQITFLPRCRETSRPALSTRLVLLLPPSLGLASKEEPGVVHKTWFSQEKQALCKTGTVLEQSQSPPPPPFFASCLNHGACIDKYLRSAWVWKSRIQVTY